MNTPTASDGAVGELRLIDALQGLVDFIEIDNLPMDPLAMQIARDALRPALDASEVSNIFLRLEAADLAPPAPPQQVQVAGDAEAVALADEWLAHREMGATQEWRDGFNTAASYYGRYATPKPAAVALSDAQCDEILHAIKHGRLAVAERLIYDIRAAITGATE